MIRTVMYVVEFGSVPSPSQYVTATTSSPSSLLIEVETVVVVAGTDTEEGIEADTVSMADAGVEDKIVWRPGSRVVACGVERVTMVLELLNITELPPGSSSPSQAKSSLSRSSGSAKDQAIESNKRK